MTGKLKIIMLKWVEHITVKKSNWLSYSCDGRKFKYLTFSSLFTQSSKSLELCARLQKKQKRNFRTPKKLFPLQSRSRLFPLTLAVIAQWSIFVAGWVKEKLLWNISFVKRNFKANVRLWCFRYLDFNWKGKKRKKLKSSFEFLITL